MRIMRDLKKNAESNLSHLNTRPCFTLLKNINILGIATEFIFILTENWHLKKKCGTAFVAFKYRLCFTLLKNENLS